MGTVKISNTDEYPIYAIGPKKAEGESPSMKEMVDGEGQFKAFLDAESAKKYIFRSRKLAVYQILVVAGSIKIHR